MRTEKREQKKENFIQKIIRTHKQKEEQKLRKQLNFLYQQVFQFYYDSQKPQLSGASAGVDEQSTQSDQVDLPEFIYEKDRREKAERQTFEELLYRLADRKVVNKLCSKRVNQLKRQGKHVTL